MGKPTLCQNLSIINDVVDFLMLVANVVPVPKYIQGGSNMTGTDLYVNKPHCAAAVRP